MPLLQKEEPQNSHRSATWLELFFDLFFVAVIGNLSHELTKNISLSGVENFAISFIAIWWIWIGITIYNERFETDGIENRLFTFLLMIPVTGLAIFSHNVTEGNLQNFLLSYMIARIIIVLLWLRAGYHNKPFRPTSNIYILGFSASILLVFAGAMLNSKISLTLFLIALIIDLATPYFTLKQQAKLPHFTTSKLPERFGLFTMIVLGEMVIGLIGGLSHHKHFSLDLLPLGIMGIVTILGFWCLYFDFIARRPFQPKIKVAILWANAHMPLMIAFVLIGVSLYNLLGSASHLHKAANLLHLGSIGFALILIGLLELTLAKNPENPHHPLLSPALKICSGVVGIFLAFFTFPHSAGVIMLSGVVLIAINVTYGIYRWIQQNKASSF